MGVCHGGCGVLVWERDEGGVVGVGGGGVGWIWFVVGEG